MKNTLFLKKYVQMHPDNKMGWYLLGKEYEKNGEIGKANYCFNQAGKIYEAFERSKIPDELWEEYQSRLQLIEQAKEKKAKQRRRVLVGLMLLLLMLLPPLYAPGTEQPLAEQSNEPVSVSEGTQPPQQESPDAKQGTSPTSAKPSYTAHRMISEQDRLKLLSHVFKADSEDYERVTVLGLQPVGDWLLWKKDNMPIMYSLIKDDTGGTLLQSYLPEECHCEPPESASQKKNALGWTMDQEERAVLASAITAYRNQTGSLPANFSKLTQPFPNNILAGSSDGLQDKFETVKDSVAKGNSAGKGAADGVDLLGGLDSTGAGLFTEPLQIIVDKQNYRLGVFSGSVLIRSYKVGLGGDLTPEGEFVITDKVVNPNGRSDGEFGSRGMQLSDTNYAIHGTDKPSSIEQDESLGCIRMNKDDIEELFDLVPMGTKVSIGKGLLPDSPLVPEKRFQLELAESQSNPHKTYHWLN